MSEYAAVTDPAELRKLIKSKELRENELTPKQREALFGKGNPNRVMYRVVVRDGKQQIVSRTFGPAEKVPDGFVDTPTKLGYQGKRKKPREEEGETAFATLPASKPQPADAKDPAKGKAKDPAKGNE